MFKGFATSEKLPVKKILAMLVENKDTSENNILFLQVYLCIGFYYFKWQVFAMSIF